MILKMFLLYFKGSGGMRSVFTFLSVSDKRRMAATENFFRMKKILFLAKVITFQNLENSYNYIACENFNRDSPNINFKIYNILLKFLRRRLETCLGTKTKLLIVQNFNLCLRRYRIMKMSISPKIMKNPIWNFLNSIFLLLGPKSKLRMLEV